MILPMNDTVVIHTRASEAVGHGHAMRSIALANAARRRGMDVWFSATDSQTGEVLRNYGETNIVAQHDIHRASFIVHDLPGQNDAAQVMQEVDGGSVVVLIDDTGPARAVASVVCDAMMTPMRAGNLSSHEGTIYLYGLNYAILRSEFVSGQRANPGAKDSLRIVLALGNGFDANLSYKITRSLIGRGCQAGIDVILTQTIANMDALLALADSMDIKIHVRCDMVHEIMRDADLVITKLGVTQLESFALGLGCVCIEPTQAHLDVQSTLSAYYGAWPVYEHGLINNDDVVNELAERVVSLVHAPWQLKAMGARASELVDGAGTQRLIDVMLRCKA